MTPVPAIDASTARSVAAPICTSNGPEGSTRTTSPSHSNSHGVIVPLANRPRRQAWVRRPPATIKIGGRCGGREALHARPDRHCDHVLFQPFVIADARVATRGEYIDEAILGNHF